MKYIMFKSDSGKKFPIIFPDEIPHSFISKAILEIEALKGIELEVYSAGFVEGLVVGHTTGKSTTLEVESNIEDAQIITTYPYLHGF